jgi:acyl-CoA thioesterase II
MATDRREPVPYPALARVDGHAVARSTSAIREDRPGEEPLLWFPRSDVDASALAALDADAWRPGGEDLAEFVAFRSDDVDLVLVDGYLGAGDDDPDTTIKQFPVWGDARDLIDVLDVRPTPAADVDDDGSIHYLSVARNDWKRPVVEGSQMLAQAIVAASREAPGRRVVSASMVFPRVADPRKAYAIELDEVATGRTFSSYGARAVQDGRVCGAGMVLLDVMAPAVIRHADAAPDIVGPYDATPYDMSVTGRDLRMVDNAYTGDPDAPVGPPELSVWVRFREVPDDLAIHAALLAQFTGHISIAAAMRPHAGVGQHQAHRTLSTAVNAISLSIHADVRADEWMLYHHRSTFAGDGMTHSSCRVLTEKGEPVASFTTDCMVRGFANPGQAIDEKTTL